jgi:hypothetical protein
MSVEHKSMRDEVLFVIGRASEPLDSGKIYERCELADEMKQVSNAIFQLKAAGKIVNAEGEGRARYLLASGTPAPAPAGKAGRATKTSLAPASVLADFADATGRLAVEVPVLGTPAEKQNSDPVADGLDLVEQAAGKRIAAPSAVRPEPVEGRQSAERLADALLAGSRAQLERQGMIRGHLRLDTPRWWIDQNGSVEILDGDETVVLGPTQARRMAQMLLAAHEALELV